tara:strand:- start:143 stop:613 length:471 start_codon:yes stop_codon:yes gene_type:complete
MEICVTSGASKGLTELSAYAKAGLNAGIPYYNLIRMSCIIPRNSKIFVQKYKYKDLEYGNRIYCVLSEIRTSKKGKEIFAGIGWRINKKDGKGIFVEHTGNSKKEVQKNIESSLKDITKMTNWRNTTETKSVIKGIKCKNQPVCTLVAAVYKVEDW